MRRTNSGRKRKFFGKHGEVKKPTQKTTLKEKLHEIYYSKVNLDTTCSGKCECCKIAMPQVHFSEFSQLINEIWVTTNRTQKIDLICTSIEYFFRNQFEKWGMESLVKPCMLLSRDNKCMYYESRPLNCFHPDTWVYTSNGPKRIKDILAGDYVYGKDGKLHKVVSTYSRLYEGNIYNIRHQGNNISSECSPDHKWLTVFHKDRRTEIKNLWTESKDLVVKENHKKGNYLSLPSNFEDPTDSPLYLNVLDYIDGKEDESNSNNIVPYTNGGQLFKGHNLCSIPKNIKIDDEFLFMIGIYLAEGSSSSQSSCFSMHIEEKHYLERIASYLQRIGIPSHFNKIKEEKHTAVLRIDSSLFARLMSELCGKLAYQKAINETFFGCLCNSDRYKIYQSWNVGDGRKCLKDNEFSTTTISEKLAVQMAQILILNNIFPRIYKNKRSDREHCSYDIHVFPSSMGQKVKLGKGTKIMSDKEYIYIPLDVINTRKYHGPLIDIEVQNSESFITSSGVVHNCRIYGLWPKEEYEARVDKFEDAYEGLLTRDQLPLNTQCPYVKRVDDTIPITSEILDTLSTQLDELDKKMGNFSDAQIEHRENYRTFADWLLLKIFGEDWLVKLTDFIMAADKNAMVDLIEQIKKTTREKFAKNMPDIRGK